MTATAYDWQLFAHVLAGMVWLGAIVLLEVIAIRVVTGDDDLAAGRLVGTLRAVGPMVMAPMPVILLGFGIWMVADNAAWDFGQTWVQVALALFAVAFAIGAAHQSRTALAAERAAAAGEHREARNQLRRWTWGMGAIILLLVAATWDMIFKPGL
jgi:uncharacterized membrane protein